MTKNNEFEKDFDFEKEYGFDPKTLLDPEYESEEAMNLSFDASMDEEFGKDFDSKFGADFDARFTAEFGPDFTAQLNQVPDGDQPEAVQYTEPAFDLPSFDESIIDQSAFEDSVQNASDMPQLDDDSDGADAVPEIEAAEEAVPTEEKTMPPIRRKPLSRERMIKEVYLPRSLPVLPRCCA